MIETIAISAILIGIALSAFAVGRRYGRIEREIEIMREREVTVIEPEDLHE